MTLQPGIAAIFSAAGAPPTGWEIGFNWRATAGFVTDVAPDTRGTANTGDSSTDNGFVSVDSGDGTITTARWQDNVSIEWDDIVRDPRLSGYMYNGAAGRYYEVRVPSGFSYQVRIGCGSQFAGTTGLELWSGRAVGGVTGSLSYSLPATAHGANLYMDINGNVGSEASWQSGYAANFQSVTPDDNGANTAILIGFNGADGYLDHARITQV